MAGLGLVARVRAALSALRPGARDAGGSARSLGTLGEARAGSMLTAKGYRILARNVRLGFAEADLVCEAPDRRTIVVVEVKTRRLGGRAGPRPEQSVGARKKRKLIAAARYLAKANRWDDRPLRVDAVAVEWRDDGEPALRHLVGVADGNR